MFASLCFVYSFVVVVFPDGHLQLSRLLCGGRKVGKREDEQIMARWMDGVKGVHWRRRKKGRKERVQKGRSGRGPVEWDAKRRGDEMR